MSAQRHLQVVGLLPARRERYLELHAAVWPAVQQRLRPSNVSNYAIFIRDDLLIGYFEYTGSNWAADSALIAADPATREWWALTDECQVALDTGEPGALWAEAQEIWHLP
ncbi:L-rhamnose mutarotase [soil metagenome]